MLAIVLIGLGGAVGYFLALQGRTPNEPGASADSDIAGGEGTASDSIAPAGDESIVVKEFERRLARLERQVGEMADSVEPERLLAKLKQAVAESSGPTVQMQANEKAAVATLRNLVSAQVLFRQSGKADTDLDGVGEYGGFLELSGAEADRMSAPLTLPHVSPAFRTLNANGEVTRFGYHFRVYLPGEGGRGVGEPQSGFASTLVEADACEKAWCCYAWPAEYGASGIHTFFVNQDGTALRTDAKNYSGTGPPMQANAAFLQEGTMTSSAAEGQRGSDGQHWVALN